MWTLVRVVAHSSKTKVQEPFGFGRFHKVMREAYYFSGYRRQAASTFKTKITRELAAEHGRQAIQITESGEYRSSSGRVVRIVEMVRRYVDETVSYPPDEPFQKSANGQHQAKITVENTTTYNLNTH